MTNKTNYSVEDCAYLAGIIDGEGSIVVSKSPGKEGRSLCYQPFISVSNTEIGLIDWLHKTFGGTRTKYTPKQTPKNSRKQVFKWQVTGTNIDVICDLIRPYSVIKKDQIDQMIILRSTYGKRGLHCKTSGNVLTKETLSIRESCFQALKMLHNRG